MSDKKPVVHKSSETEPNLELSQLLDAGSKSLSISEEIMQRVHETEKSLGEIPETDQQVMADSSEKKKNKKKVRKKASFKPVLVRPKNKPEQKTDELALQNSNHEPTEVQGASVQMPKDIAPVVVDIADAVEAADVVDVVGFIEAVESNESNESPAAEITATTNLEKIVDPVARGPKFSDLPLSQNVLAAVVSSGYDTPTPVQSEIIPHMLNGRDVLAQSQTGTGKTAAFALPILSQIDTNNRKPQVLVLAPTRELAIQVANSFSTYGSQVSGFNVAAIYGGQDYEIQFRQIRRGVQVVVATPGRLIDHVKRGTIDLSEINCLVLDEADEMLNMGFLEDVEFVLKQTPKDRQIALFSATLPTEIRNISKRYLNDPVKITIKKKTMTADSIRQRAVFVAHRDKVDVLTRFLEAEETDGVIVFTRTKDATIQVAEQLNREGLSVAAINGDMPQRNRERTIEQLKAGRLDILVATDVAARGLDVTRISHVFNFDLPDGSESYIHRVGRTGRAGRKGEAIIFLSKSQNGRLRMIERATKQPIEIVQAPTAKEMNAMRVKRFKQRIADVVASQDLSLFKKMIMEHAEESETPMEMIAAALAHIGQRGLPFFAKDRKKSRRELERENRDPKRSRDRGESRNARFGKGGRERQLGPPEQGMARYRIEVGRNHGVKPGNIVGAVANEAGIQGNDIGPIKIHGSFSTVDLPAGMPKDVYQTLQETKVVGKPLCIRLAGQESEAESYPRHKRTSFGRSSSGSSGGGRSGARSKGKKFDGPKAGAKGKSFGGGKSFSNKNRKRKSK